MAFVADALLYGRKYMDGQTSLKAVLNRVADDIGREGLDVLSNKPLGSYAAFRPLELAGVV